MMVTETMFDSPFRHALAELGAQYPNLVVIDADLQRATETDLFQTRFPDRHFDVGIAEANMVGVATGLALSGKIAFCGTFACFMSQRVCDQVAISVAYCDANVKMAGFDPGLASGGNGASHQGMLDLAIMRAIPRLQVLVPGDATETRAIMEYAMEYSGPIYMRAPRGRYPILLDSGTYKFQAGQAVQLRDGCDATIIACGVMVPRALQAAGELESEGTEARVLNMSSIKPIDRDSILLAAQETGCIVTAENHNVLGGLGSAVTEVVSDLCPVPVKRVGIDDSFGEVGPVDWLAEKYGISASHIVAAAKAAIQHKKAG